MLSSPREKIYKELAVRFLGVEKSFGNQKICRDITLDVKKGQVLSMLGPSGCGKTITLKMLVGLITPDRGQIMFDGKDVAAFTSDDQFHDVRRRISMVFQGSALFDSMNVYDNVSYPLRVQGVVDEEEIYNRVAMTLGLVGLPDAIEKMPSELSGGMKKRIGLARAIITNPEIILYDEPTAGLDPINTRRIVDLILLLQERLSCTSMVVSHDMQVVETISEEAAFFYGGMVRTVGSFDELKFSEDAVVRGFIQGDPNIMLTTQGSF